MSPRPWATLALAAIAAGWAVAPLVGPAADRAATNAKSSPPSRPAGDATSEATFRRDVRPFLERHCVRCHGADKQEGDFSLHEFDANVARRRDGYAAVLERLRAGDMPPEGEPRPDARALEAAAAWMQAGLASGESSPEGASEAPVKPSEGNLVPHVLLFGVKAGPVIPPGPRLWRMRPTTYRDGLLRALRVGDAKNFPQPFDLVAEPGLKDYAALYSIDHAGADVLLRNAQAIVESQTRHKLIVDDKSGPEGRVSMHHDGVREFQPLLHPNKVPSAEEVRKAIVAQFKLTLVREPSEDELARVTALYAKNVERAGHVAAAKTALAVPLLMPETVYRFELGRGAEVRPGVRLLGPKEIAFAVSLALSDRRDDELFKAAEKGEPTSREAVAAQVRRMLDDPKFPKPRLLGFFREYFGYDAAEDVFKDRPDTHLHRPEILIADTDRLVLWVLERDRDVLKELLTTTKSYANYSEKTDKGVTKVMPAQKPHPPNDGARKGPEFAYGLTEWPEQQPVDLTDGRMGVLMQPAWLVARSGNFDNDPIRRGRWIRERLLGGTVPDLPIGVAAKIPDEPHETLRTRIRITRVAECWKCHQKMDDLGLPFEQFDHYGLARSDELVLDVEATEKNVDKKGKPLGKVFKPATLDARGVIAASGEPSLDGPVADAVDLVRKLADSERVRQVFVRHAFRYYLGRNETPDDAQTLQDADRAYVESGGSFKALVVSLLSSESFLCRSVPVATASAEKTR